MAGFVGIPVPAARDRFFGVAAGVRDCVSRSAQALGCAFRGISGDATHAGLAVRAEHLGQPHGVRISPEVEPIGGLCKPKIGIYPSDDDPYVDRQQFDANQGNAHERVDDQAAIEDEFHHVLPFSEKHQAFSFLEAAFDLGRPRGSNIAR